MKLPAFEPSDNNLEELDLELFFDGSKSSIKSCNLSSVLLKCDFKSVNHLFHSRHCRGVLKENFHSYKSYLLLFFKLKFPF